MRAPHGYTDDQGAGWFILYIIGGLPLGLIAIAVGAWWVGAILLTYFWWPTWWGHARGDYRRKPVSK